MVYEVPGPSGPPAHTHSVTHPTPARTRWTHYTSIKAIPPFIIQPSYLLLLRSPCSFVLCLPCLYISSCSQQLKPGWSLSRLAGTANLHIVPFIRLAPTHNKTPLTRSLKSAARTQCDWVVIAFEWAAMNALIYFLLLPSFCLVFFFFFVFVLSRVRLQGQVGCSLSPLSGLMFLYPRQMSSIVGKIKGEWIKWNVMTSASKERSGPFSPLSVLLDHCEA